MTAGQIGAVLALAAGLAAALLGRIRERRLLRRLERMLDEAERGGFVQRDLDETLLSSVEERMARYLSAGAAAAQKVEAERDGVRQLVSDISHQTKTPAANILLYAQLLAEEPLSPQARQTVEALRQQTEKLNFLLDALVKLSRLETGMIAVVPRPGAVQELLEAVAEEIRPAAERKGLALTVEPTEAWAAFDKKWTAEALYNLADNAVKYTPAGGSVCLRAVEYDLFCRLDVTDTGIGVAEEELGRIFGRFYRSRAVVDQEGVGIGLFLARQIAAAEGGYCKASSRLGQGSTFSLFLPCVRDRAPRLNAPES